MALPKSSRDRLRQIHRWLKAGFKTGLQTKLQFRKLTWKEQGSCEQKGRVLVITINTATPTRWQGIDTLIHEYAHAMSWKHVNVENERDLKHDEAWGVEYARLYTWFYDLGGAEASRKA
ncbi:MAG: hypothetical protein V3S01_01040 [Dehalococcoidia bacterium]